MQTVVELAAEEHEAARPQAGYRLVVTDCMCCFREIHLYVPDGPSMGVTWDIPCPHCRKWDAEAMVFVGSGPIIVRACKRKTRG